MAATRPVGGLAVLCVLGVVAAGSLCAEGTEAQSGQRLSLDDVLVRAGEYAIDYGQALTSVLADEHYTQRLVWRRGGDELQARRLRSEIAFIRLADSTEWLTFRNVLAVDEVPIAQAAGRLGRLFQASPRSLPEQARLIAGESARYNLGPFTREINLPTTALHFVHPTHRGNCRFDKEREELVAGEQTWVVGFKERDRGSLIRRGDGRNLPAEGRLWIVPTTGRIVRSERVVKDFVRDAGGSRAEIYVTWRRDEALDLFVPIEMRERYEGPWTAMRAPKQRERYDIDGVASYSNYRRFTADFKIK
jgi:hypothetical protein